MGISNAHATSRRNATTRQRVEKLSRFGRNIVEENVKMNEVITYDVVRFEGSVVTVQADEVIYDDASHAAPVEFLLKGEVVAVFWHPEYFKKRGNGP